ncbi:hypothetical protein [Paracoccus sp. TOH]|uniref:hypothetical protein n=1 Tax=Paracoccus sp. TOH TaxID=1263728 RepID=UPI0025AED819|nr:hypothetical protein [Paracoccus sp. TOH]WJS87112.1 hypothetical protein NBE95_20980 [Paracoccus sp. TOH]
MRDNPKSILDEIKRLDAAHWSTPSNGLAIQIEKLEKQYEATTGQPCPAWPRRVQ